MEWPPGLRLWGPPGGEKPESGCRSPPQLQESSQGALHGESIVQKDEACHMMLAIVSFWFRRETWTQECACVANCKHSVIWCGGKEGQQGRANRKLSQAKTSCSNTEETGPQIRNRRMLDTSPAAQMVLHLCFGQLKGGVLKREFLCYWRKRTPWA